MPSVFDIAMNILSQNPQVANTPQGQYLQTLIRNQDMQGIKEMGMNMSKSLGVTPQNLMPQMKNMFGFPF